MKIMGKNKKIKNIHIKIANSFKRIKSHYLLIKIPQLENLLNLINWVDNV